MPNLVFTIFQHLYTLIDDFKNASDIVLFRYQFCFRHHFLEGETTAKCAIQCFHTTVGGVHSANDIHILRHTENVMRIRQFGTQFFTCTTSLIILYQRNQFAKNVCHISTINLINNHHIVL